MATDRSEVVGVSTPDNIDTKVIFHDTEVIDGRSSTRATLGRLGMVLWDYGNRPVHGRPGATKRIFTVGIDKGFNGEDEAVAFPVAVEIGPNSDGSPETAALLQAQDAYINYLKDRKKGK